MAEALEQVKRQFGRNAVILHTRTLTRGGFLGIGGSPYIEITAAAEPGDLSWPPRRASVPPRPVAPSRIDDAAALARTPTPPAPVLSDALLAEVGSLKSMVSDLVRDTRRLCADRVPEELYDTYRRLVENEVAEQIAQQLINDVRSDLPPERVQDPGAVRARLAGLLERMLPTAGPIQPVRNAAPTIIALVGPTGVGKTTTIAKLAANFCLRERRKVGLITIDTYRIAAVEQLKTYAEIIDVPLTVAMSPDQLSDAVRGMSDRDVILIDTAGRSQRDAIRIKDLERFFRAVRPDEIHLVLSGTCSEAVLHETIERFRAVGIDRVIFTKLDEAIGFGVILSCLTKANAKLSYVTTGQDVPDDIEVGRAETLARLILDDREPAEVATGTAG